MTRGNPTWISPSAGGAGASNSRATGSPGRSSAMAVSTNSESASIRTATATGSRSTNSADFSHFWQDSGLSGFVHPLPLVRRARARLSRAYLPSDVLIRARVPSVRDRLSTVSVEGSRQVHNISSVLAAVSDPQPIGMEVVF